MPLKGIMLRHCFGALSGTSAHFVLSKPRCFGSCFRCAETQADDRPFPDFPARVGVPGYLIGYYLILLVVRILVGPILHTGDVGQTMFEFGINKDPTRPRPVAFATSCLVV